MRRTKEELEKFNYSKKKTFMEFLTFIDDKYLIDVLFGRMSVSDLSYDCGIIFNPYGWKLKYKYNNNYRLLNDLDYIHLIQDELKERGVK